MKAPNEKFICADCQKPCDYESLPPAQDILMRHVAGDIFSDVECHDCGSLCFPMEI